MFWNKVSGFYDFFEAIYNGKAYQALGKRVAEEIEPEDIVLECACGTVSEYRYDQRCYRNIHGILHCAERLHHAGRRSPCITGTQGS